MTILFIGWSSPDREKAGYAITAVATADGATAEIRKRKFDCISLDLSLGGTNGALLSTTSPRITIRPCSSSLAERLRNP